MPTITVKADEVKGTFKVEVDGVEGKSCTDLTSAFEDSLGNVNSVEKKREYHTLNELNADA
jgi:hypothetical protein